MFKANLHYAIFKASLPLLYLFLKMWHEVIPLGKDDQAAQCGGERLKLHLPPEARSCLVVGLPRIPGRYTCLAGLLSTSVGSRQFAMS
jgi:hypothetical protein